MNPKLRDKSVDRLFEGIMKLQSLDECYAFFEDIGTISEIRALAQRLDVAAMLAERRTYREIHVDTGASEATISRVSRALYYGADGYRLVLSRLGCAVPEDHAVRHPHPQDDMSATLPHPTENATESGEGT